MCKIPKVGVCEFFKNPFPFPHWELWDLENRLPCKLDGRETIPNVMLHTLDCVGDLGGYLNGCT